MDDDDDFEDLFNKGDTYSGSSQDMLDDAANDLMLDDAAQVVGDVAWQDIFEELEFSNEGTISKQQSSYYHAPGVDSLVNAGLSINAQKQHSAIDQIEGVIEGITDQLLGDEDEIKISLRRRPPPFAHRGNAPSSLDQNPEPASRVICFPGRNEEEAWRFTVIVRILELMHEALRKNVILSKRDIFYRDPALFTSQSHVDRYIDDIAFNFDLPRSALNVTAAAKGLVAGCAVFHRSDGTTVDAAADREGQLVPIMQDVLFVDMKAVEWVLIIEKEASFRSIAASPFWEDIVTRGIIVTGKGYPDVATRALLHLLAHPSPRNGWSKPTVHGLVDFDPDGIAILSIYKHGSMALVHENAHLCVPGLMWLGLRSKHVPLSLDGANDSQGLLWLSKRDRAKARGMLGWERVLDAVFVRDLQLMLVLNIKTELQILDALPQSLLELLYSMSM